MKQEMKNIHVSPTDKLSRLFIDIDNNKLTITNNPIGGEYFMNQNIYITSDEEIKELDWIFDLDIKKAVKADNLKVTTSKKSQCWYYKKIILTTDPELIKDGVQSIDDEFLEWFIKNPSCQYGGYKDIDWDKIITQKEEPKQTDENGKPITYWGGLAEPKQETLEEAADVYVKLDSKKTPLYWMFNDTFKAGAKWQQERMYSEEDMFEFSQWISHEDWVYLPSKGYWLNEEQEELEQKLSSKEILNMWFEQFKKK